ncbi:hypothetical protein [Saccharothrix deserti]|uniref:hypothetical protein n=1 Tax=Saccharothrix deserti TaxID=2593674 RepID=UPI00131E0E67|nr:hypothetical protein [Saccharothrix deserti]
MSRLISVRVAPEWECFPFWVRTADEVIADNCSAERLVAEFGAPADVAKAIDAWDDEFQAVYNPDDPMGSGFPDEATTAAWHERGERLAGRLASALRVRTEFHTARGELVFGG